MGSIGWSEILILAVLLVLGTAVVIGVAGLVMAVVSRRHATASPAMLCAACGARIGPDARFCTACGASVGSRPPPRFVNENSGLESLIPTRNVPALVGYYLGVFSIIPCLAILLGPAAAVCGWLGLRTSRELPRRIGRVHAWIALVLGVATFLVNLLGLWLVLVAWRHGRA